MSYAIPCLGKNILKTLNLLKTKLTITVSFAHQSLQTSRLACAQLPLIILTSIHSKIKEKVSKRPLLAFRKIFLSLLPNFLAEF